MKPEPLKLDFDHLVKSFQLGLIYQETSKNKDRLSSRDVRNQYFLKRDLAALDSDEEDEVAKEGPSKKKRTQ